MIKQFSLFIFFSNYFIGCCAVLLCIESNVQQFLPLNNFFFYWSIFSASTIYYTKAYLTEVIPDKNNLRSVWYYHHQKTMNTSQLVLSIVLIISSFFVLKSIWQNIFSLYWYEYLLIVIFPLVGLMYYGILLPKHKILTLRNSGWFKPFVIGFVWTGIINIYPILYYYISSNQHFQISFFGVLLFIKNFLFISVLGMMFDIKDYASDYNKQLKTFVVQVGLRKTIFEIILPLSIIGFSSFLFYTIPHHFSIYRILINVIPVILLIIVAYSLHQRKSILYYLAFIDGLLLVKAVCGIIGSTLIK